MAKTTLVTRKEASEILKVSLRTLDRYIRKNALAVKRQNGSVYLKKDEVAAFQKSDGARKIDRRVNRLTATKVGSKMKKEAKGRELATAQDNVYKELCEALRQDLREHQKRLEAANYRVGQLEMQLKNAVPLLSHESALKEQKKEEQSIKEKLKEKDAVLHDMEREIDSERYNKMLYAVILIGVLVLQPILWVLLKS